jgi:hypothetical protein
MKQFINLSSIVINKLHITEIVKKPGMYKIYMTNSSVSGWSSFVSGYIRTIHNVIDVCETKNPQDYKRVTDWINTIK